MNIGDVFILKARLKTCCSLPLQVLVWYVLSVDLKTKLIMVCACHCPSGKLHPF